MFNVTHDNPGDSLIATNTPLSPTRPNIPVPSLMDEAGALADLIVTSLDDDKAEDIVVIDLAGRSSMADGMVITTGRSARHVVSLAEHLMERLKAGGYKDLHSEGLPTGDWVLIDAGDIIVHLFRPEIRTFYSLEKMWETAVPEESTSSRWYVGESGNA